MAGLDALDRKLSGGTEGMLRVTGIPNPRLASDLRDLAMVDGVPARPAEESAPDQEELRAVGARNGFRAVVTWCGAGDSGSLDAVFVPVHEAEGVSLTGGYLPRPAAEAGAVRPMDGYVNTPGRADRAASLVGALRDHLAERLSDMMPPATITLVDRLPAVPDGAVRERGGDE
ncbi:hypothetical protein [Streptomyces sp. NBC_01217]|uniref:hypothetical protein n=1 Tax=Streptomyces sp. NBC_01217 TaxID=2903779 RepID=UPI002E103771|nr:hypothetical protein OG507_02425 [Streptomyces sp. NBC_01217]